MKNSELIQKMTPKEKAAFLSGKNEWETRDIPRLGIPSVFCADGPSGIRKQAGTGDHLGLNPSVPATCFPSAAALANSWDIQLEERIGEALGEEAMEEDVNVLLGPGLNIKRNPLCGRNFEYFSEDPYLSGKMAAAFIRGAQSKGVAACPKHFAVNSQELRRMAMDSVIDERTLREIYLTGFEIAVKEGNAKTIMTSYNEVNGTYANENLHLLKEILRDEWGFDGAVITDWGASNDHALGVKNGSTLEMPTSGLDAARELLTAVDSKKITMQDIDERVDELLSLTFDLQKHTQQHKKTADKTTLYNTHHQLARTAAGESTVLLKNENALLPLSDKTTIAVIGDFALLPRYQGAGSSMVNSTQVDTIEELVKTSGLRTIGISGGYRRDGKESEKLNSAALELAKEADVVLFFFGLNEQSEVEGQDRPHLRIPQNQIMLIEKLANVNQNLVGILSAGSVIEMPWLNYFKALLHGSLSGQAGAGALLDILTGKINPSGKLAETYLLKYEDTPSRNYYPSKERTSEYREGIYVGYRYFDTADVPVRFPFGYGLSYTQFSYEDLEVNKDSVSFSLKNVGKYDGAEVVQLYVGLPNSQIFRAAKELKGFQKVFLKAGETCKVTIHFDDKTFRYWNIKTDHWEIEKGEYQIMIGASSKDIRLTETLIVNGTTAHLPYETQTLHSYKTGNILNVSDTEYELLLGRPIPSGKWNGELTINDALCQMVYAKSPLARFVYRFLNKRLKNAEKKGIPDLNTLFQYNMPFRAIAKMTGGLISMDMVRALVVIVNGHFFRGIGPLIRGFFRNQKLNKEYEKDLRQI